MAGKQRRTLFFAGVTVTGFYAQNGKTVTVTIFSEFKASG
jgi:hypothetical protein